MPRPRVKYNVCTHFSAQIKGVATGSKLGHKDVPLSDVLVEKVQVVDEK